MKSNFRFASYFLASLALCLASSALAAEMPRFRWENFTTEQRPARQPRLQRRVDGDRVWAGTENGLALYENGKWRVFTAGGRPGAPRRAVRLALDKRTHDVWVATMGGLSRYSAGPLRQLHAAQQRPAQRRGLRRFGAGRLGVGRHRRRRRPPQHADRRVEPLQRAQHPDVRDLDLRRDRRRRQGLLRGLGRRRAGVRREDRSLEGLQRSRTARPKWCCSKTRG